MGISEIKEPYWGPYYVGILLFGGLYSGSRTSPDLLRVQGIRSSARNPNSRPSGSPLFKSSRSFTPQIAPVFPDRVYRLGIRVQGILTSTLKHAEPKTPYAVDPIAWNPLRACGVYARVRRVLRV